MVRVVRIVCLLVLTIVLAFTAHQLRRMLIIRGMIPGGNVRTVKVTDKAIVKQKIGQKFWIAWDGHDINTGSLNRLALPRQSWQRLEVDQQVKIVSLGDNVPYLLGGHVTDRQLIRYSVILSILVTAISLLLYFDINAHRTHKITKLRMAENAAKAADETLERDTTSIYSMPKTKENWGGRKSSRASRHAFSRRHRRRHMLLSFWDVYVNVIAVLWIVTYSFVALGYTAIMFSKDGVVLMSLLLWALMLFVVTASVGILKRYRWGQSVGYTLCVLHLIAFPIGTLFGLLMLIGLVGARNSFK